MTQTDEYVTHLLDLLRPVGPIQKARFFGGVALKLSGRQFAMVMSGRLYFLVNDTTRARYQAAGSKPFSYATKKWRVEVSRYYEVPADVLEDAEGLRAWAQEATRI
jgi:DNA transformation protein and related proteins